MNSVGIFLLLLASLTPAVFSEIEIVQIVKKDDQTYEPVVAFTVTENGFDSKEAYVILVIESSLDSQVTGDVYYLLGRETPIEKIDEAILVALAGQNMSPSHIKFHREELGNESTTFKMYFPRVYQDQRTSSNEPDHITQYLVKGKDSPQIVEVKPGKSSLSANDCNVLNTSSAVLVSCGPDANKREINVSEQFAECLSAEPKRPKRDIDPSNPADTKILATALKEEIITLKDVSKTAMDDAKFQEEREKSIKCTEISEENGEILTQDIEQRPLEQSMLLSDKCFTLHVDQKCGILVWWGKDSTLQEKRKSLSLAEHIRISMQYPAGTPVRIVDEAHESADYMCVFKNIVTTNLGPLQNGQSVVPI